MGANSAYWGLHNFYEFIRIFISDQNGVKIAFLDQNPLKTKGVRYVYKQHP